MYYMPILTIYGREDYNAMTKKAAEEELFIGTAESEHIEMYVKAIWYMRERGEEPKISSIAKLLNVTQPSVVQMLDKLDSANLVNYGKKWSGNNSLVEVTQEDERIGK